MQIELFDEQRSLSLFNSGTEYQSQKSAYMMTYWLFLGNPRHPRL
ncbi:hypothetical protein [Nostoc sp.]